MTCYLAEAWHLTESNLGGYIREAFARNEEPAAIEAQVKRLAKSACAIITDVSVPNDKDWRFSFPRALDKRYTPGVVVYGPPGRRQQGDITCNCVTCSIRLIGRLAHEKLASLKRFPFLHERRIEAAERSIQALARTMSLDLDDLSISTTSFAFEIPATTWIDDRAGKNHEVGPRKAKSAFDEAGPGVRVGLGFIAV